MLRTIFPLPFNRYKFLLHVFLEHYFILTVIPSNLCFCEPSIKLRLKLVELVDCTCVDVNEFGCVYFCVCVCICVYIVVCVAVFCVYQCVYLCTYFLNYLMNQVQHRCYKKVNEIWVDLTVDFFLASETRKTLESYNKHFQTNCIPFQKFPNTRQHLKQHIEPKTYPKTVCKGFPNCISLQL